MRAQIEQQFHCRIIQWAEPQDDSGALAFSALASGTFILADSLPLLIEALQALTHQPLRLAA